MDLKTVVGLFDDFAQAKTAALNLESAGIAHNDVSIVANNEGGKYAPIDSDTSESGRGHAIGHDALVGAEIGGVAGLLMALTGFAIPGFGWIAGAGWLMATILGAGTGALIGGLVGALTDVGVPEEDAAHYNEGVRRGGTLVAVKAQDDMATRVAQILGDAGAVNIDERAATYESTATLPTPTTYSEPASVRYYDHRASSLPGVQTGGRDYDGTPDTRGISEKAADAVTGDRIDDKTGKPVA
jgi:hypothetical protein